MNDEIEAVRVLITLVASQGNVPLLVKIKKYMLDLISLIETDICTGATNDAEILDIIETQQTCAEIRDTFGPLVLWYLANKHN